MDFQRLLIQEFPYIVQFLNSNPLCLCHPHLSLLHLRSSQVKCNMLLLEIQCQWAGEWVHFIQTHIKCLGEGCRSCSRCLALFILQCKLLKCQDNLNNHKDSITIFNRIWVRQWDLPKYQDLIRLSCKHQLCKLLIVQIKQWFSPLDINCKIIWLKLQCLK